MREVAFFAAMAALFLACEADDRSVGGNGDGCTTTSCMEDCQAQGYAEGFCSADDQCICGSGDADTDTDSDSDSDSDSDADGDNCDVDLLFVYDTSGSMMDAVSPLTSEAFPAFAAALESYPDLGDVHIAVTTNLWGEHAFENGGTGFSCDGAVEETVQTSAFLTEGWDPMQPYDAHCCEDIPDVNCAFASGERWIEGPSSTMLDEFACVANVPCQQDVMAGEPTLEAGLKALQYAENDGFIRGNALLVVVFITDEEDQSAMNAQAIHDGLLALKGGDEEYVAVVTIAGPQVGTEEVNSVTHAMGCFGEYGGTEETPGIIAFTSLFGERGVHYEMCGDNDLSGALTAAFDVLELSCEQIIIE